MRAGRSCLQCGHATEAKPTYGRRALTLVGLVDVHPLHRLGAIASPGQRHYAAPEGSHASNAANGRQHVLDFRAMVQALHAAGLRMVLDVASTTTPPAASWTTSCRATTTGWTPTAIDRASGRCGVPGRMVAVFVESCAWGGR